MKILFVFPGLRYTQNKSFLQRGSESVIFGIAKELSKKGHEIYITGRFGDLVLSQYDLPQNLELINIPTPRMRDESLHEIPSNLLYSRMVLQKIKKISPDVISLNERFSALASSRMNIPKTFTTHNPDAMEFYRDFSIQNNPINHVLFGMKKKIEEYVMSRCNQVIVLNNATKEYLNTREFRNVTLIPNALDPECYVNRTDERFILSAGRLDGVKGIHYLIRAFCKIDIKLTKDYKLVIIGSGPIENEIKLLIKESGVADRIELIPFMGKQKLIEYLSRCSFFVLPSLFETFSVTLIEAMACGKPVIASDIPGPQDIISHGINGYLFQKSDIKELTHFMEILIGDEKLRKDMGKVARMKVEEEFSFVKVAKEYQKVFESIVGGR